MQKKNEFRLEVLIMVNAATVGLITALHGTNNGTPTDLSGIVNVINKKADKSYVDTELDKKSGHI